MDYKQTLNYLFSALPMYQRIGQAAYKADLKTTVSIDKYFEHPHKNFKSIHIAGTNGKGSVSHMIASVMQEAGYKTGLYTSPHLKDFRERIKVNGQMISQDYVVDFVKKNKRIFEDLEASFFEMSVALAFKYFSDCKVEFAIIETGMGGRLDSTNIIKPILSIITNIGLDHTKFLGNTITEIASEKAGIIKQNIPVIIGETQSNSKPVFENVASKMNSDIFFADSDITIEYLCKNLKYNIFRLIPENKTFELDLKGNYQAKNLTTVIKSLDIMQKCGIKVSEDNIKNGLKNVINNTGLKGRWQVLNTTPLTICDIGHNVEGVSYIVEQILQQKFNKLRIIWGMVNDKDISQILQILPQNAYYYFTQAQIPRALPAEVIYNEAIKYGLQGEVIQNVEQAYNQAVLNSKKEDMIFIGGSTFVVSEIDL
jgi:dihydrofolate synthase / folylpolyglutamate synthase